MARREGSSHGVNFVLSEVEWIERSKIASKLFYENEGCHVALVSWLLRKMFKK